MIILLTAGLYLIILLFLIFFFKRREGYYSTVAVFGISSFIYYVLIPIETVVQGTSYLYVHSLILDLDSGTMVIVVIMAIFALIGFSFGYFCSKFVPIHTNYTSKIKKIWSFQTNSLPFSLPVLILVSFSLIIVFYSGDLITSFASYADNISTTFNVPVFAYLVSQTTLLFSICVAYYSYSLPHSLVKFMFCFILLISWGIFSSNKDPILLALLGFSVIFFKDIHQSGFKLIGIMLGPVVIILLVPLFSLYRGGLSGMELITSYYFSPSKIDPAGPFLSLVMSLSSDEHKFGFTYINDLTLMIPKFLWHNRPIDLAMQFAQDHIPNWQPGQGFGYSLMAEGVTNFGKFGSFLHYFLFGLFWGGVWKILRNYFDKFNFLYFRSIYYTLGYYLIIISHRGPIILVVKTMLQMLFLLIPLSILIDRIRLRISKNV